MSFDELNDNVSISTPDPVEVELPTEAAETPVEAEPVEAEPVEAEPAEEYESVVEGDPVIKAAPVEAEPVVEEAEPEELPSEEPITE